MSINPGYITKIESRFSDKVVSIISSEFSDIELSNYYKPKFEVVKLKEAITWTKFTQWFNARTTNAGFFASSKPLLFIINTDMISRIPKEKKGKKSSESKKKSSTTSVEDLIKYIRFFQPYTVIFITEQPLAKYSLIIKPMIFGDVPDFSDWSWVASVILYSKDEKLRDRVIDEVDYYEVVMGLINDHIVKRNYNYPYFNQLIKIYFDMRYEFDPETTKKFIKHFFRVKEDISGTVNKPSYYRMFFQKTVTNEL